MIQVCRNGAFVQGLVKTLGDTVKGPCPALTSLPDGTYSCGVVLNPKKYIRKSKYRENVLRREFSVLIGAGTGCDEVGENPGEEDFKKIDALYYAYLNDAEKIKRHTEAFRIVHGL